MVSLPNLMANTFHSVKVMTQETRGQFSHWQCHPAVGVGGRRQETSRSHTPGVESGFASISHWTGICWQDARLWGLMAGQTSHHHLPSFRTPYLSPRCPSPAMADHGGTAELHCPQVQVHTGVSAGKHQKKGKWLETLLGVWLNLPYLPLCHLCQMRICNYLLLISRESLILKKLAVLKFLLELRNVSDLQQGTEINVL
jgi:hypothetical protein